MKIVKRVCDVTADPNVEVLTVTVAVKIKHSQLDAAGSSDWEFVEAVEEYDLSHAGAIKIIQELIDEESKMINKNYSAATKLLEKYRCLNSFGTVG